MIKKYFKIFACALILFLISWFLYKLSNPIYRAYILNSENRIEVYMEKWNKSYNDNYSSQNNDTVKAIYEVFDAFYTPRDLKRIGESEWGDSIYVNPKYILVQNKICYSVLKPDQYYESILNDTYVVKDKDTVLISDLNLKVTDSAFYTQLLESVKSEDGWKKEACIENFRPKTIYSHDEILYEDKKYYPRIAKYLGNAHFDFGVPNLMSPAQPKRSNRNRQNFLMPYLVVWHGHWGSYWHVTTHPLVRSIILDNDLATARVYFRVVYQFGGATLKKRDGAWVLIESELTGIE